MSLSSVLAKHFNESDFWTSHSKNSQTIVEMVELEFYIMNKKKKDNEEYYRVNL